MSNVTNEVQSSSSRPRRKISGVAAHRFSLDYVGFPRINDDSDESEPHTKSRRFRTTSDRSRRSDRRKRTDSTLSMEGTRGNRGLQYLATLAANMGAFAFGTALSYPAVALPSLRNDDPYFKKILTEKDESWIGSVFALGAVVAGPAAGFAIERMGRRRSMLVLSVPFFLSWMLINIATNVPMILVGRFLTGFFSGVFLVAAPIFTAEIADVAIRGAIGASLDMSSSVGILFIYIVGTYVSWRIQALICAAVPLFIFLLMLFVPESPAYLLEKGKLEEAKASLASYKGKKHSPELILAELDNLQQEVLDSRASESTNFRDLLVRPILVPVSIAFMVFVFQVICGLDPILVYTVDIFKSAGGSSGGIDEYTSTIVFGVIEWGAGVAAAFFVDKTGRRFLLLLSEAVMVLSLATLGLFFFIRGGNELIPTPPSPDASTAAPELQSLGLITYLPLTSLSLFILAYSIGLGPVGYLLMGEILPLRVKGLAGCLLTSAKWLLSFLVTYEFDDLITLIGEAGCFWLFAGLCALGFLLIFFFVPETNGRSLEEIQRTFRRTYSLENIRDAADESRPLLGKSLSQRQSQNEDIENKTSSLIPTGAGQDVDVEQGSLSSSIPKPGYQSINAEA